MARGSRTVDREFWHSGQMNNRLYAHYYRYLTELAVSMFEWKNLPETVDERFMELVLFSQGQAVFFKDEVMGYLCLQNMVQGKFNVYRVPMERRAYAVNGYQKKLNDKDSVIIYNDYLRGNSMLAVRNYAEILWDIDQTIRVNARAQKTPVLITCDESERMTMQNVYQKYDGNQPVIYGSKELRNGMLQVLKTDAPDVTKNLYELKTKYFNEALTYLGISNINVQKKERLVADEVTRMVGGTIASRYQRLEMRRKACDEINKMFGLNLSCDYRDDFREITEDEMIEGDSGGNEVSDIAIGGSRE